MLTQRETHLQLARAVLDWNRKNLRHDTQLTVADVAQCFGERFVVEPNGRHYAADRQAYLDFLNGMKSGMQGIEYQVLHTVADGDSVLFDMAVQINHTDGRQEHFIAMLLMRFDTEGKVKLWKEVYLPKP
ncbi:nuclear transport factor 2 family protein [Comamonas sp. GB3 AK4-5]|uniref:nuclear transport factor 2 family protein n=1 Tax=Comamonas sp. GB3 AK4-5 TaxID=3231487 RepID=UPI00351EDDCB